MITKLIEIRDIATCITAIAIKTEPKTSIETSFLARGGWSSNSIILIKCNGECVAHYDPFEWRSNGTRTMFEAHRYIQQHFDEIPDYFVCDVRYILGETDKVCESDIYSAY